MFSGSINIRLAPNTSSLQHIDIPGEFSGEEFHPSTVY
jgi:hypothetical protein